MYSGKAFISFALINDLNSIANDVKLDRAHDIKPMIMCSTRCIQALDIEDSTNQANFCMTLSHSRDKGQ